MDILPPHPPHPQLNLQGLENLDPSLVTAPTKTVLSYLKARLTNVSCYIGRLQGVDWVTMAIIAIVWRVHSVGLVSYSRATGD